MPFKPKKYFYLLPTLVILLGITILLGTRPYYNWDLLPYMALTIASSDIPFDSTHAEVWREASLQLPHHDWLALYNLHPDLASDPAAFQSILKYFEIKPLYILTIKAFHLTGLDLVMATYLPSLISYFLILLIMFWWLQKSLPPGIAALTTLLISVFPFLLDTARYSSPDMLCALFLLAGVFMLTELSILPGLIVAGLSIFIRPDAALLFLLLMFDLYKTQKIKFVPTVIISIVTLLIALSLTGTEMLKEFLFTTRDYSGDWNLGDWARNYVQGLWQGNYSMVHSYVPFFSLIALLSVYLRRSKSGAANDFWSWLIPGILVLFIIRFLLHPAVEDRMLIPCYLLIVLGFCQSVKDIKTTVPLTI